MDDKNISDDVDEKLLEYYSLKKEYISKHYDKFISPILMYPHSKLQKRRQFQKLQKPLCINCSQPVGTIFERTYHESYNEKQEIIVFTAKCGNILNPCDLNIEIHKSVREPYDKVIKKADNMLNKIKLNIIKLKNKILFSGKGNADDDIVTFNGYKDDIIYYTDLIGSYTEENIMINDNPEDIDRLKNLIVSLNQIEIIQFKEFIEEYDKTSDNNFLNKAVNMYVSEIIPKLKEIQELKYKTNYVERDSNGNFVLVQSKYSPEGMNLYDKNADEVVSFITGIKLKKNKTKIQISKNKKSNVDDMDSTSNIKSKSKKSKTLKTTGKTSKTKTSKKTLKISDDVNEDDVTEDVVEDVPVPVIEEKSKFKEIIELDDGDIVFDSDSDDVKEDLNKRDDIVFNDEENDKKEEIQNVGIGEQQKLKVPKRIGKNIILNEATEAIE